MGRAKRAPIGHYEDNPDRDDAASTSSAVPLRDHDALDSDDEPGLPPYTDEPPAFNALDHVSPILHPPPTAPPTLDAKIDDQCLEDAKGSTYTRLSPTLSTDPVALKAYIEYQASVVPTAYIRVQGMHTETRRQANNSSKKERIVDFDIRLDATNTISRRNINPGVQIDAQEWSELAIMPNDRKTYRGGRMKSIRKGFRADVESTQVPATLDEWCHLFCASSSKLKSFTLRRTITNRDEALLTSALTSIIRATHYRGHLTITFPIHGRSVTVLSAHPLNRLRRNRFFFWVCIILQLWIITWPILWFMTRRWEVAEAKWPYKVQTSLGAPWTPVLCDEGEWVRRWGHTLRAAVMGRTQGAVVVPWVTEAEARQREAQAERVLNETQAQGGLMGAAAGLMRGVGGLMQARDAVLGWGGDN